MNRKFYWVRMWLAGLMLIAISLLGPDLSRAWADVDYQWKFVVPVKLKNLDPVVDHIVIRVKVLDKEGKEVGNGTAYAVMNIPVPPQGEVNQTVEIKVKPGQGTDISEAVKYRIEMKLESKNWVEKVNDPYFPWAKAKPGTTLVDVIEDNLPLQIKPLPISVEYKGK